MASELGIKLDSEECAFLRGGSVEPDKWKDFPHHFGVDGKLENYITKSRRYFIEGNQNAHLECLGIVFHYIADKWTLFSGSAAEHANWENEIDKCAVSDLESILQLKLSDHQEIMQQYLEISNAMHTAPRGKDGALAHALKVRPRENQIAYSSPDINFNTAFRMCLAIGISIRSITTPPNELVKALNLLTPWNNSKELSDRVPPKELEPYFRDFLSRIQQIERELVVKEEDLKKKQTHILKNLLSIIRAKASILKIKYNISEAHHEFKSQVQPFIHEYQPHLDWYYWGSPKAPSLWELKDLFDKNDANSCSERDRIKLRIREKTLEEIIEHKKQGYQLVFPGVIFTISATFDNPLSQEIENASLYVCVPHNWRVEIYPKFFTIPPNATITQKAKIHVPTEDKLVNYIVELRCHIPPTTPKTRIQIPDYERMGGYSVKWMYDSLPTTPSLSFTSDRSSFIKLTVVSRTIRKDWVQKSAEDALCGVIGCDDKRLDWKCPKCKLHFCDAHKNHTDCEELSKLYSLTDNERTSS